MIGEVEDPDYASDMQEKLSMCYHCDRKQQQSVRRENSLWQCQVTEYAIGFFANGYAWFTANAAEGCKKWPSQARRRSSNKLNSLSVNCREERAHRRHRQMNSNKFFMAAGR